jgi:type II secretory pathway component PulF|tara:strand:+ start:96 stop:296 length:201 start_codon:yes stop_codon:yes gene_type:complete
MEEKYYEILRHYVNPNDCATVVRQLLSLHNDSVSLKQGIAAAIETASKQVTKPKCVREGKVKRNEA